MFATPTTYQLIQKKIWHFLLKCIGLVNKTEMYWSCQYRRLVQIGHAHSNAQRFIQIAMPTLTSFTEMYWSRQYL